MKPNELFEMLKLTGLPVAYRMFQEEQELPYIIFYESERPSFSADNRNYHNYRRYNIELYTEVKDFEIEKKLENLLDGKGIFWEQIADDYIDEEKMNEVVYQI